MLQIGQQTRDTSPCKGEVALWLGAKPRRSGGGLDAYARYWFAPTRRLALLAADLPLAGGGMLWRWRRGILSFASAAICGSVLACVWWVTALGPPPLGEGLAFSTLVVDRDGKLLRPYTTPEGRWRLPAAREHVDPRFLDLLVAYEDKRFTRHFGIDPLALARAFAQLVTQGRVVSGGSTLTMQVARLLEPRPQRSLTAKLRQIVRAIEIERSLSKDEILSLYLRLAPYGGNLEGVRAASLTYFGKEPRRLTLGEAALLVGLPQSPEQRRPDRSRDGARTRAIACSIGLRQRACSAWMRSSAQKRSRCPTGAGQCPCLLRTQPTRWRRRRRTATSIVSPSTRRCRAICKSLHASARKRWAPTSPLPFLRSTTPPARCSRVWPRRTISTFDAPVRST